MRSIIVVMSVLFILPASLARGTAAASEQAKAPAFTLQDQYDRTVSLGQFEGRIVVLIASDKEGKAQNPAWERSIRERYGENIAIIGIADVSSVPFFLKGKIRNDLKKDGDSILLDWKGEVFKAYRMVPKVSNIVLIGRDGLVRYRSSGASSREAVEGLFKEIDLLK